MVQITMQIKKTYKKILQVFHYQRAGNGGRTRDPQLGKLIFKNFNELIFNFLQVFKKSFINNLQVKNRKNPQPLRLMFVLKFR